MFDHRKSVRGIHDTLRVMINYNICERHAIPTILSCAPRGMKNFLEQNGYLSRYREFGVRRPTPKNDLWYSVHRQQNCCLLVATPHKIGCFVIIFL